MYKSSSKVACSSDIYKQVYWHLPLSFATRLLLYGQSIDTFIAVQLTWLA